MYVPEAFEEKYSEETTAIVVHYTALLCVLGALKWPHEQLSLTKLSLNQTVNTIISKELLRTCPEVHKKITFKRGLANFKSCEVFMSKDS